MRFGKPKHLSWRELGRRLWVELKEDSVTEAAAQLAFYFLFSLFPFLFFLVTLAAYLPFAPGAIEAMVGRLEPLMPATALEVVEGHL
ncbi:MAG TPA: YhjD/YihY/BrkB family envelope integrity protein, partial [Myxococcaceae bacterium]|nr:YhjD/YihY/BrkB family envelope integrity protein [Myxococcaceae bacterium]